MSPILVFVLVKSPIYLLLFSDSICGPSEKQSPFEGFDRFDRDDGPRGLLSLSGDA